MLTLEFSVLMALAGLIATGSLVQSVRTALPQIAGLRQALKDCPETREVRFTVKEVVVGYNDGKVVPLRPRRAVSLPRRELSRAA